MNHATLLISIFLTLLLDCNLFGQNTARFPIPEIVLKDLPLKFPLAGGLNAPQLSAADLNNDGLEDLFVFDRVGNVRLTFLNDGSGEEQTTYSFAPTYEENFPILEHWVLLRDFNGDGVQDLFAYSDIPGINGIRVHKGFYRNDSLNFERIVFDHPFNILHFPLRSGNTIPLFVSTVDYPAIDDLDCDGDLDILTFNSAGGYVEFYANRSQEFGYGLDTLIFELAEDCWGGVFESGLSEIVDLAESPGDCAEIFARENAIEFRHAGSTLLTLDIDEDGDRDLILGDITFNNINLLSNAGSCNQAWINDQDPFFPSYDLPVQLPVFPAAFHLDVNRDGKRDLLVAPNSEVGGEDRAALWFYENISAGKGALFQFAKDDFLVGQMLDFGSGANPVFVDYNQDGRMDLVVGNHSQYNTTSGSGARLFLFENTGTKAQPAYKLVDDDFLELGKFEGINGNYAPCFADLDDDGDLDVLLGTREGTLFFARNVAGPGQRMVFDNWDLHYFGIDVGLASVPELADLNGDGLLDLIIGERNGNINFFPNSGTLESPLFDSLPVTEFWKGVDTRSPGIFSGYSAPVIIHTNEGKQLLAGSEAGTIRWYQSIEGPGTAMLRDDDFGRFLVGKRTRLDLADVDNDSYLELAVGNLRGGIALYNTPFRIGQTTPTSRVDQRKAEVRIYPNPVARNGRLQLSFSQMQRSGLFKLYSITGRLMLERQLNGDQVIYIDVSELPSGTYFAMIRARQLTHTQKIIVLN